MLSSRSSRRRLDRADRQCLHERFGTPAIARAPTANPRNDRSRSHVRTGLSPYSPNSRPSFALGAADLPSGPHIRATHGAEKRGLDARGRLKGGLPPDANRAEPDLAPG